MRYQFRRANTLSITEIPVEGEPIWDDQGRRLGFWNAADGVINWFRIPRTGENDNYIPEHRWVGTELQFKLPSGEWGVGENLRGEGIDDVTFLDNGDGTVKLQFHSDADVYELDVQFLPIHKGQYQIDAQYVPMDEVFYEGSSYRVKFGENPPIGTLPTDTIYFVMTSRRSEIFIHKTPASSTSTGTAGEVVWDDTYIYVCIATDTWKRALIETW